MTTLELIPAPAAARAALVAVDADDAGLIDTWIRAKRGSANTRAAYRRDADRLVSYLAGRPLALLRLEDLLGFADDLAAGPLAPNSQKRVLSAVKSLLTFGQKAGYLQYNVGAALELPTPRQALAERILTVEQVQRMIALEPAPVKRMLIRLLYASGGRVSEICGLRWRDAVERDDAGQLTLLGKGNKTRAVLLSSASWRELVALRPAGAGADAPIFCTKKGKAYDRSWILRIVKKAAARAGLPAGVSPHWMRHAHASHALDAGAPISLVRDTLGHADVKTTGMYLHARPEDSSARYLPI